MEMPLKRYKDTESDKPFKKQKPDREIDSESASVGNSIICITNIEEALSQNQIRLHFANLKYFLPISRKKHLGVLYIENYSENDSLFSIFQNPRISYSGSIIGIDSASNKLQEIISMIEPYFNYALQTNPEESKSSEKLTKQTSKKEKRKLQEKEVKLQKKLKKEKNAIIQELIDEIKPHCHAILSSNYNEIKTMFESLESDRAVDRIEKNPEKSIWFIIFYFCYFFLNTLNTTNFSRFTLFFDSVTSNGISNFLQKMGSYHFNFRAFAMDALWQIFFVKDQFDEEIEILNFVIKFSKNNLYKLTTDFSSKINLFSTVLQSEIIQNKIQRELRKSEIVDEYLDSVYFIDFPKSFNGFTLFNRNILIKDLRGKFNIDNPLLLGFVLVVLIHEFPHFIQRYGFHKDSEWFDHETPSASKEAGLDFEVAIFGKQLNGISHKAAKYILKSKNWDQANFQEEFNKRNKEDLKVRSGPINYIRFNKNGPHSNYIHLGMCPRLYGRIKKGIIEIDS